jgi:hypothetical protein
MISRLVFRRWASAAGMKPATFASLLVVPAMVIGVALLLLVRQREIISRAAPVDMFLVTICVAVFFTAWGYGIFGAHAGDATFREFALLRVRPVGVAALRAGVRVPPVVVGLLLGVALGPAAVLEINRAAGYGWWHAGVVLVLLVLSGTSMGRLSYAASGKVNQLLNTPSLRLTFATMLCLVWAVGGIALFIWSLRGGEGGFAPVYRVGFLIWPLLVWLVLTASVWAYAVSVAVTVALVAVASQRRPFGTESGSTAVIRRGFNPVTAPFHTRLLMLRLWRNPRGREWLLVGVFISLLSYAAVGYAALRLPLQVDLWSVRMLSLLTGLSFGVLVRSLSDRHRPVEARWQIGPAAHVRAAFASVLLLGLLTTSPMLVALVLDTPSPDRVAIHLTTLVLQAAIAVTVSFLLVPTLGSGAVELLSVIGYFAVSFGVSAALEQIPAASTRVGVSFLLAMVLLLLSGAAESGRRHRVVGIRRTGPAPGSA